METKKVFLFRGSINKDIVEMPCEKTSAFAASFTSSQIVASNQQKKQPENKKKMSCKVGPRPVISRVITLLIGVITPVTQL